MIRNIYFCKSWFRAKKKPTEIWSADRAKLASGNKQPYTVLIDSVERPYCFIEFSGDVVVVGFLDNFLRESLTYIFQEVGLGNLFLTMATHREFDGDTDVVMSGETYVFEQDGGVSVRRESFFPHSIENSSMVTDVKFNYSKTPEFGQYDDLIKVERHIA